MTMRERIARAHAGVMERNGFQPWDALDKTAKEICYEHADAALDALMEPTHEMIAAAFDAGDDGAGIGWQAMIRAAKES